MLVALTLARTGRIQVFPNSLDAVIFFLSLNRGVAHDED